MQIWLRHIALEDPEEEYYHLLWSLDGQNWGIRQTYYFNSKVRFQACLIGVDQAEECTQNWYSSIPEAIEQHPFVEEAQSWTTRQVLEQWIIDTNQQPIPFIHYND